jgi:hypothetical protein
MSQVAETKRPRRQSGVKSVGGGPLFLPSYSTDVAVAVGDGGGD